MNVPAAVTAVDTTFSQALSERLRGEALERGWSPEASETLSVEMDNGTAWVRIGPSGMDMEYGTQDCPPMPVAQQFANRLHAVLGDEYADQVASAVWNEVG